MCCFLDLLISTSRSASTSFHRNRKWRIHALPLHGNKRHEAGTTGNGKDGGHKKAHVASSAVIVSPHHVASTEVVVTTQVYVVVGAAATAAAAETIIIVAVVIPQAGEITTYTCLITGVAIGR